MDCSNVYCLSYRIIYALNTKNYNFWLANISKKVITLPIIVGGVFPFFLLSVIWFNLRRSGLLVRNCSNNYLHDFCNIPKSNATRVRNWNPCRIGIPRVNTNKIVEEINVFQLIFGVRTSMCILVPKINWNN